MAPDVLYYLVLRVTHKLSEQATVDAFLGVARSQNVNYPVPESELPTNIRQMLTFLEDQGHISGEAFVTYDACTRCSCFYRGEHAHAEQCHQCGCLRVSGETRNTRPFVYR